MLVQTVPASRALRTWRSVEIQLLVDADDVPMPVLTVVALVWVGLVVVALVLGRASAIADGIGSQQGSAGAVKVPAPISPAVPAAVVARPRT